MMKTPIAIAFALAVVAQAGALAQAEDTPPDAEAIVRSRCLTCHNVDRLKQLASRTPEGEREARWTRFLRTHNLPAEADRAAVVPYLLELTR